MMSLPPIQGLAGIEAILVHESVPLMSRASHVDPTV